MGAPLSGALLKVDEIEVAEVDGDANALSCYENRVLSVNGIGEDDDPTPNAEVPELNRHDAFSCAFAHEPLHQEAHKKEALTQKSNSYPDGFVHSS